MKPWQRAWARLVTLLAATAIAVFPSAALAGWQRSVMISPRIGLGSYVQVAIDGKGNATAVWQELQDASPADYVVMSATRSAATGRWTHPVVLSTPGQAALLPRIAVDHAGAAVAVWESGGIASSGTPSPPSVQASVRASPTSAWTRPALLSGTGIGTAMAKVGIDAHGNAVALWFTTPPSIDRIQTATGNVTNGRWSAPVQLAIGHPSQLINPQIAVNPRGDAIATWEIVTSGGPLSPNGQTNTVMAAVKPSRHAWNHPAKLGTEHDLPRQASTSFEFPGPHAAIDANGDAIVVWQATLIPEASLWRAGRTWSKAAPISNTPALTPHVAMDPRGDATVVWVGPNFSVVAAARSLTGHRWTTPKTLAPGKPDVNPYPQVAMDSHGDAVATWTGNPVEASVRRGRNGQWQRAVKLGRGGISQAALDQLGRAIVMWQQPTGHNLVIAAARYRP